MRVKRRHRLINGLPVKDSKEKVILHITSGDIKKAERKDPANCAAAIACRRSLGASEARVHVGRTYLRFNGHWERYLTSKVLRDELIAYDRGSKFSPGEYTLATMQPHRKHDHKRKRKTGPHKTKKKRKIYTTSNIRPIGLMA